MTKCRIKGCEGECFQYQPAVLCEKHFRAWQVQDKHDPELALEIISLNLGDLDTNYDVEFYSLCFAEDDSRFFIGFDKDGDDQWEESEPDIANILNDNNIAYDVWSEATFEFSGRSPQEVHKQLVSLGFKYRGKIDEDGLDTSE